MLSLCLSLLLSSSTSPQELATYDAKTPRARWDAQLVWAERTTKELLFLAAGAETTPHRNALRQAIASFGTGLVVLADEEPPLTHGFEPLPSETNVEEEEGSLDELETIWEGFCMKLEPAAGAGIVPADWQADILPQAELLLRKTTEHASLARGKQKDTGIDRVRNAMVHSQRITKELLMIRLEVRPSLHRGMLQRSVRSMGGLMAKIDSWSDDADPRLQAYLKASSTSWTQLRKLTGGGRADEDTTTDLALLTRVDEKLFRALDELHELVSGRNAW